MFFIAAKQQISKREARKTGGGTRFKASNQRATRTLIDVIQDTPAVTGVPGGKVSALGGKC